MSDIKEIARLITEDPDVMDDGEELVWMSLFDIKVPRWFKEWWDGASSSTKATFRPGLADPEKREVIIDRMREYLKKATTAGISY
jgi:hypothetical protein